MAEKKKDNKESPIIWPKEFLIGTQYHRPPTPKKSEWDRDLKQLREYGMNIIRTWLVWNWYHIGPDKFDFSDAHELLDLCAKHQIRCVMLLNLESAPPWLVKQHPDALYVSSTGEKFHPEAWSNTPAGGFPGFCYHHPEILPHAQKFITKIVQEFRHHPAVYCWEPHNEPIVEPSRNLPDNLYCYCDQSIQTFQEWLKQRYHSIAKLNEAWGQKFRSFGEVEPPRYRSVYANWVDWRVFMSDTLYEHDAWRTALIRKEDPTHPIAVHSRGWAGLCSNYAVLGIDDRKFVKNADIYGVAAFSEIMTIDDISLMMTAVRSAAQEKPVWFAEFQGGPAGTGFHREGYDAFSGVLEPAKSAPKPDEPIDRIHHLKYDRFQDLLELVSWTGIAEEGKAVLYWQYRPETCGIEYGFGLTQLDGTPNPRLEKIRAMSQTLQRRYDWFQDAKLPARGIAMGFSPINDILNYVGFESVQPYKEAIRGLYRALYQLDYPIDVVRMDEEGGEDDLLKYHVVYLPFPSWISPRSAERVAEYIYRGGTVVAETSLAQYDGQFLSSTVIPGLGLDTVFGCRRQHIRGVGPYSIRMEGGYELPARFYREALLPTTARPLGWYENGEVAVTVNQHGDGLAYYIGGNAFMQYFYTEGEGLRRLMLDINSKDVIREAWSSHPEVWVRRMETRGRSLVFVQNNVDAPRSARITVLKGLGKKAYEILPDREEKYPTALTETGLEWDLQLSGLQTRIFEVV